MVLFYYAIYYDHKTLLPKKEKITVLVKSKYKYANHTKSTRSEYFKNMMNNE